MVMFLIIMVRIFLISSLIHNDEFDYHDDLFEYNDDEFNYHNDNFDYNDDANIDANDDGIDDAALCMPQWPQLKGGPVEMNDPSESFSLHKLQSTMPGSTGI